MYKGIKLGGKIVLGLSSLLIPTSSAAMIMNTTGISSQTDKYLDLVSVSNEKVSREQADFEKVDKVKKLFAELPKHKYASSYKDLVDLHLNKKRCYVKISLMSGGSIQVPQDKYRNLEEPITEWEKERVATGVYSLGGKRTLEDACYRAGIGGVLWIKETKDSGYNGKTFWTLQTSGDDKGSKSRYMWKYQVK